MSKPTDSEESGLSDEESWFEALSGSDAGHDPSRASREGIALRRGFDLEQQTLAADSRIAAAMTPAERERRRAARQWRKRTQTQEAANTKWPRHWLMPGLALAASILVALVVPRPWGDTAYYEEPPTVRGAVEPEHRIDAHPKAAAEALAATLREAGLQASLYQHKSAFIVDVSVVRGLDDAAVAKLRSAGVDAAPGFKRIEFDSH
jgi:hypothetical protein